MFDYTKETTEELLRIISLLTEDGVRLRANGYETVAAQNTQIVEALVSELQNRKVAS